MQRINREPVSFEAWGLSGLGLGNYFFPCSVFHSCSTKRSSLFKPQVRKKAKIKELKKLKLICKLFSFCCAFIFLTSFLLGLVWLNLKIPLCWSVGVYNKNEHFFPRFLSFSSWNRSSVLWLHLQLGEISAHPDLQFPCLFKTTTNKQAEAKNPKHWIHTNAETWRLWCSARPLGHLSYGQLQINLLFPNLFK